VEDCRAAAGLTDFIAPRDLQVLRQLSQRSLEQKEQRSGGRNLNTNSERYLEDKVKTGMH